uniref:Uncharacterized protein n=1 Tax=Oryza meridionalis TaxID=40149 RepID=A0A0E0CT74_9ORYZ
MDGEARKKKMLKKWSQVPMAVAAVAGTAVMASVAPGRRGPCLHPWFAANTSFSTQAVANEVGGKNEKAAPGQVGKCSGVVKEIEEGKKPNLQSKSKSRTAAVAAMVACTTAQR